MPTYNGIVLNTRDYEKEWICSVVMIVFILLIIN